MEKEINYWKEKYEELKLALDLASIQITITDGNGVFTATNKPCEEFIGVKEDELIGKSCFELERTGVFDLSATAEVLRRKKKVRFVQRTKSNKILLVTGHPIFDENNNIIKIVNISYDITEKKKLESQLEETEGVLRWYKHEMSARENVKNNTLVAQSKTMSRNKDLLDTFAYKDILILLLGDTGVGKNYTAQYIHKISQRRKEPFVAINCGAIPEQLLESELFGYEKGSFTGALANGKEGLFQFAGGGTLLLDEIAEMPLGLQVKLLSVLDEKKFRRIGGREEIDLKARIIVATNKDLQQCVANGTFRDDLYYRINVLPVTIPSLAERKEDIPDLADKFLKRYNEKYDSNKRISLSAYEALLMYSYPGNIRELKNIMERLVIISENDEITALDIERLLKTAKTVNDIISTERELEIVPLKQGVENYEKKLLKAVAEKYKTTREQAKALEVDQSTIVKKRKKYSL